MRKAVIDLDWLDNQIASEKEKMERHDLQEHFRVFERGRNMLKLVRVKCTPIEEQKETFLPPTCIQEWESAKYCQNENKCELCKTIKQ